MINPTEPGSVIETRVYPSTFADAPNSLSAVSWGAIFAGAAAAAALSLVLLLLGVGLGLSAVSPWVDSGLGAKRLGTSTILWLTFTQLAASGLGGYLAGRLRIRWAGLAVDEVFFRDTAHGFLTWCIATLATALLLTSVTASVIGGVAKTTIATGATAAVLANATLDNDHDASADIVDYFVDRMFRSAPVAATTPDNDPLASQDDAAQLPSNDGASRAAERAETIRILRAAMSANALAPDDVGHLGRLVAKRTGLGQAEAEDRVNVAFADAKQQIDAVKDKLKTAADETRRASAWGALWLVVSLFAGAFVASWFATFGGRLRDT